MFAELWIVSIYPRLYETFATQKLSVLWRNQRFQPRGENLA